MDKKKQIRDKLIKVIKKQCICCNGNDCDKCCYDGDDCVEERLADAILDSNAIIHENAVVLTREEKQEYESLVKLLIYDKPIKSRVYEFIKDIKDQARKETAEKFARLVEFHSVSTRDNDGREMFTISALGLKEILTEEFGFKYDEIAKEFTEGKE